MLRSVLSEARGVSFTSYARKVAWLRHLHGTAGVSSAWQSVNYCEFSARCSLRRCQNVRPRFASTSGFFPQAVAPKHCAPKRQYGSGVNGDDKEKEDSAGEKSSSLGDIHDDELKDLLKEISEDFKAGGVKDGEQSGNSETSTEGSSPKSTDSEDDAASKKAKPPVFQEHVTSTSSITSSEIEDFSYYEEEPEDEVEPERVLPIELKRGETGVYDLEELMTVLSSVNAQEPCVIHVPESRKYVTHMVIVSAFSYRHMKAIAHEVSWIYKRKKTASDPYIRAEGVDSSRDWFAMDMDNIALHIFMPEARSRYDLETLWTIGPELDPQCLEDDDPYALTPADLLLMEVNRKAAKKELFVADGAKDSAMNVSGIQDRESDAFMGVDNRPRSKFSKSRTKPLR